MWYNEVGSRRAFRRRDRVRDRENGLMVRTLAIGGQRRKDPVVSQFRMATEPEIRAMSHGSRQFFIANDGCARMVTITSVKTWKTRPDVSVGIKYGMYGYARWDLPEAMDRLCFQVN